MIVLVTGGAGFVGLNLLRRFLRVPDCEVRILDDFSNSSPERLDQVIAGSHGAVERVRVFRGHVGDAELVRNAIRGAGVVIHLAAQTGVVQSLADPLRDLQVNIVGTFNVLNACKESRVRRFILASSSAVVGNTPPPQHEEMPVQPLSPYGASKAAGEAYCNAFHSSFGIETLALRFSNVYGPLSWSKGSVVAHFAKQALAGKPLVINGDGSQTRDFLYVEDLAEVIDFVSFSPIPTAMFGRPCNVATGIQTRILDLARVFQEVLKRRGRDCKIEFGSRLAGDVAVSAPAADRIRHFLPSLTFRTLADGLPSTIDWFLKHWTGSARASALDNATG